MIEQQTQPEAPATVVVRLQTQDLIDGIVRAKVGLAYDTSRPILAHLLVEPMPRGIRLIAADNFRITLQEIEGSPDYPFTDIPRTLLWGEDLKSLLAFLKANRKDETEVRFESDLVTFTPIPGRGSMSLIPGSGTYPNYESVLPDVSEMEVSVSVDARLLGGILVAAKDATQVRFYIRGPVDPVVLEFPGTGFRALLMPLRMA